MDMVGQLNFTDVGVSQSNGLYPSTDYTCINCELATREINWNPTPLVPSI
jgi:hypothetical protein